jgi:hypothetical protein
MLRLFLGFLIGLLIGAFLVYMFISPSEQTTNVIATSHAESVGSEPEPDGSMIYEKSCKVCHPMRPPAGQGPPILGLATHYREAFSDKDKAIAHMVDFMKHPDVSKSKVEARAIKRFGLMPAMPNSEKELKLVSEWLWDQYDPSFECGGGRGRGRRN